MAGYLLGGLVFGLLTDKLGRKPTFLISNTLMVAGGMLAAMSPEILTFLAARYFMFYQFPPLFPTMEDDWNLVGTKFAPS